LSSLPLVTSYTALPTARSLKSCATLTELLGAWRRSNSRASLSCVPRRPVIAVDVTLRSARRPPVPAGCSRRPWGRRSRGALGHGACVAAVLGRQGGHVRFASGPEVDFDDAVPLPSDASRGI
jgi:hypothetical protein